MEIVSLKLGRLLGLDWKLSWAFFGTSGGTLEESEPNIFKQFSMNSSGSERGRVGRILVWISGKGFNRVLISIHVIPNAQTSDFWLYNRWERVSGAVHLKFNLKTKSTLGVLRQSWKCKPSTRHRFQYLQRISSIQNLKHQKYFKIPAILAFIVSVIKAFRAAKSLWISPSNTSNNQQYSS